MFQRYHYQKKFQNQVIFFYLFYLTNIFRSNIVTRLPTGLMIESPLGMNFKLPFVYTVPSKLENLKLIKGILLIRNFKKMNKNLL